jgi:hypothetical protein
LGEYRLERFCVVQERSATMSAMSIDRRDRWRSWVTVGAILMMISGGFKLISGIVGLFRDQWLVQGFEGFLLVDITGLAVWWLIIGALLLLAGMAALAARRWGYIVGIVAASIAAINEFFMIPYYPIWSIILLVMYVIVVVAFVKAPAVRD